MENEDYTLLIIILKKLKRYSPRKMISTKKAIEDYKVQ